MTMQKCIRCNRPWIDCPRCYGAGMLAAFDLMVSSAPAGFNQTRFIAALTLRLSSKKISNRMMDQE